jgi:SNF2 family DNA or RNA helicase
MLSSTAIDKYLARDFLDWRVYKALSYRQLNALARKHGIDPATWAKAKGRKHQKIMILIGARARAFAFWADPGMGKTFVALALARHFRDHGAVKRVLVLVPNVVNKDEWVDEIGKHAADLAYTVLPSPIAAKWQALEGSDSLLVLATYTDLYLMLCRKVSNGGSNKLQPDRALVKRLLAQIDGLVMDESTSVKTRGKLPFRLCRAIAKQVAVRFALSGTPHGRDPGDLWAQMFLIDGGATLGEHQGLFRATFFRASVNPWGVVKYSFLKPKQALLNAILANGSIRFKASESDLPKLVAIRKYVRLPEDAAVYYQRAYDALRNAGNVREMRNNFLRMRQISSGFVGFVDDDTGARVQHSFDECPKRDLLLDKIVEALPMKQIVFYQFTWSALRIGQALTMLDIGHQHLWSGTPDSAAAIAAWRNQARYPVMLLQNQFGIGLNLQHGGYGHFYESPVSPILRKQCERRFHRQESPHDRVFMYDYITRNTCDEAILGFIADGYDLMAHIIDGRNRLG